MENVTKHKNTGSRLLAKLAVAAIAVFATYPTADAFSPSYYAQSSKLSTGKWIKIKITDSGVYEITYDQLRDWGFTNPEAVNVYGMGGTALSGNSFSTSIPDDIPLNYTIHDHDKLYFYGGGDVRVDPTSAESAEVWRNYYSTSTYYLLSDREPANNETRALTSYIENSETEPLTSHISVILNEEELQNPAHGGALFVGRNIEAGIPVDVTFDIVDMDQGNSDWSASVARFVFAASAGSQTRMNVALPSGIDADNVNFTYTPSPYNFYTELKYRLGSTLLTIDGTLADGSYTFGATRPSDDLRFMAMDYAWLMYPRKSSLDNFSQIEMNYPEVTPDRNFAITAPARTRLLNATLPYSVSEFETRYDEATGMVVASFDRNYSSGTQKSCRVVAFDPERRQKTVEYVGEVENSDYHAVSTPTMVVITTRQLLDQANELAQAHRDIDGMDVVVAVHDDLFNEFAGGTPDAMAYRRFAKMLYDRDRSKFKYILFYGPTYWDNRGLTRNVDGMMLSYQTTDAIHAANDTKNYGSDIYFGMLSDNFDPARLINTKANVAVGRIPATSPVLAAQANRKIIKYISSMPSSDTYDNVIIMSDDGDGNIHINQAEQLISYLNTANRVATPVRAHNLIYQWDAADAKDLRAVTAAALKRGAGYFAYVGHATPESFAAESVWSKSAVNSTEYAVPVFAMLSTCDAYGYDRADNGITEAMMFKENGGMIGVIASCRTVYGHYNQYLAIQVTDAYGRAKSGTTIGDIWLTAYNNVIGNVTGDDAHANTLCYNLCGDPAVRVTAPDYSVSLTSIGEADGLGTFNMQPLVPTQIEGCIIDASGSIATDFNGTATLTLYDSPYTVKTMPRATTDLKDSVLDIVLDHDILTRKTVRVTNGEFSTTLVAPVPVHEGNTNRLTLHADSDEGQRAHGIYSSILLTTPSTLTEELPGDAPVIEDMAINNFGTADGVTVGSDVSVVARGTIDEVGINNSSSIGAGSSLVIDGTRHINGVKEAIHVDMDNKWTLNTSLGSLTDGPHSATLTIVDNAGRRVSHTLSFTVINVAEGIRLTTDVETARTAVVFDLEHPFETISDCRLIVEDRLGNTILSKQNVTFPYTWTFAGDGVENPVADGHYTAYLLIKGPGQYGSSACIPIVIVK